MFRKSLCLVGLIGLLISGTGVTCTQPGDGPQVELCVATGGLSPFLLLVCPGDSDYLVATANGQPVMTGGTIQVDGDGNIHFDFSGIPGAHSVEIIGPDGTHYIFHTLVFTWHPPSGGSFTINVLNQDGDVLISWSVTIQIVVVVVPPPPDPPPPVQPTVTLTDVQPAGGIYDDEEETLSFQVKVSVSNGDGRQLNLRCLPYVGNAFNTAFAATNGVHTINLDVALTDVTALGNNFFNVYDGGTAISQWWTVSITVH